MTVKNITELLNAKKYAQIKKELNEMNSVDLAELLEQFPQESMVVLFRLIAKETAAEVFTNMNTEMQQALISTFTEKELTWDICLIRRRDHYCSHSASLLIEALKQAQDPELR